MAETSSVIVVRPEDVLEDFRGRMSLHQAERKYHLRTGTLAGAIERGELTYIPRGTKRRDVTPSALAEWIARYTGARMEALPGLEV